MDFTLIQFLSQCRDEENEVIDRWLNEFQPISLMTNGLTRFGRGKTRLAEVLGTTESAANND